MFCRYCEWTDLTTLLSAVSLFVYTKTIDVCVLILLTVALLSSLIRDIVS